MSGWIKIHRGWMDNPILNTNDRRIAWLSMIEAACWKPTPYNVNGTILTLERGQFCASYRQLADKWGWSKSAVSRFFDALQTGTMVTLEAGHGKCVVTICNYGKYQDEEVDGRDTSGTATGTRAGHERDIKEEGKKLRRNNNPLNPPCGYSVFPMPEGVDPDCWRDFLTNRKGKKLANTATAHKRLLADLQKFSRNGWTAASLIEHAASHGWGGIYDPGSRMNGTRRPSGSDDMPIC